MYDVTVHRTASSSLDARDPGAVWKFDRRHVNGVDQYAHAEAQIDALRSEMRQGFAELGLRLTRQIPELDHRIERLEEQRGLIRTP
jgi:hypothetical protein